MRKSSLLILTTLFMAFLTSCAQENADNLREPSPESDSTTVTPSQTAALELTGVEAYEMACASCHELGLNGAPATGDVDAWSDRSALWEAVLFHHAKNGYLGMPSKGGKPELSDRSVAAAAEYMLLITYPDRLPD
jgi:cytochrome c5